MAAAEGPRSSSSADSYIGSLISLTSKSEIRYEGVLYSINTDESSIGLRNVRSFGTEGRKKDGPQVPPGDKVYEYILFRGSDIKDLQVKSSPSVQTAPPISNDPAIIQSHYSHPASTSTTLPSAATGSLTDTSSHSHTAQLGLPGSNFQGGLPLYQPGGNLGSWGPSPPPPGANGSGIGMPMYWQGFYGPPNGLPHLHQQSLLQPPPGLSMPPSMQQPMQYPGFNTSLSTGASNLPKSNVPEYPSHLLPAGTSSVNITSTSIIPSTLPDGLPHLHQQSLLRPPPGLSMPPSMQQPMQYPGFNTSLSTGASNLPEYPSHLLPASTSSVNLTSTSILPSTLPSTLSPMPSATLASEILPNSMSTKAPISAPVSASIPSLSPLTTSGPDKNVIVPPISTKPRAISGLNLPYQTVSQSVSSILGTSNLSVTEAPSPSLVTPGQLLQYGPTTISSSQALQTAHKDVEVVQVSSSLSSEPSAPLSTEAQPPILPLPTPSRAVPKVNGTPFEAHHGYRGRERGRGMGGSHSVMKFTEEFDFMAMNEKFNKDEVWGHLGKSNKSHSRDKEGDGNISDENDYQDEDDAESSVQTVYNKDDFFDTLSCNALDHDSHNGRTRFSEQMKIDTETFGEFPRYRGGRGGRGINRGGRFRGGYYGRGYGYGGRGRGRGYTNHAN